MARFLLLGSGEFEPWSADVERVALQGAPDGPVLILPTASAPEGDAVFDRWASMGLAHYEDMGLAARVIDLKAPEDAEREDLAAEVAGASMVFFSGGKPQHLASVIRGTRFEAAVRAALDAGTVYAGCSAGAMVASRAPDPSGTRAGFGSAWLFGLGLVPNVSFGVHWDRTRYIPGLRAFVTSRMPEGAWFVGIDERTAILGDGTTWEIHGLGSVAVVGAEDRATYRGGDLFRTPSV